MALASGKLRHRVELQEPSISINAYGERQESWVHVAYMWASVEPLSAREFIAAQQMQSKVMTRIVIRKRSYINATMRVIFRGQIFNIEGVLSDPVSGLEYQTLPCSEGILSDGSIILNANILYSGTDLVYNGEGITYNGN